MKSEYKSYKYENDTDTDSGVREKNGLAGKFPSKWPERLFIALCTLLCLVAAVTVTSHPDDPIEFRVSNRTVDGDPDRDPGSYTAGGRKTVYWRVKPDAIPRWKRFANKWRKVRSCHIFWESDSGYTKYDHPHRWLHQNSEMTSKHTVEEFLRIEQRCHTVGDIKEYSRDQRQKCRTGSRRYIERKRERDKKEKVKNMWDEAVNSAAAAGRDLPQDEKKVKKIW